MRRDLRKHKKELKRRKKRTALSIPSPKNQYWPAIFCLGEKLFIGVSNISMKVERGKPKLKVDHKHWDGLVGMFRSEKYRIDMTNFEKGDPVHCPVCGSRVDFRIWISAKKPEFINVEETDIEKLPDS